MIDGHEVAEAHGQVTRLDGDVVGVRLQRRDDDLGMAAFFLGGQQGDEGGLQVLRAGLR